MTSWDPVGLPLEPWDLVGLPRELWDPVGLPLDLLGSCRPTLGPPGTL